MGVITKGKIGRQDMQNWDGTTSKTFARTTDAGGSVTLTNVGFLVDVLTVYGEGVNYTAATLQAAIDGIGSNVCCLVINPGAWAVTADLTFPATMTLYFPDGASFAISAGKTAAISGYVISSPRQIFTGSGTATVAKYPQNDGWWGNTEAVILGGTLKIPTTFTVATGDLYYANASGVLTRLAIGSSGDLLTITGGVPVWSAVSSSAGLAFTSQSSDVSTAADTVAIYNKSGELYRRGANDGTVGLIETLFEPGGRLCVATGVPIPASGSGAATVYYAFYKHDLVHIHDGTSWVVRRFTELSQALNDNTKSPAAAAADSAYDMFVWLDGSTLRCTRGPAWSSLTARGTGAGTTELERVNGRYVNKIAITNGPAAQRGLYVGSINTVAGAATVSTQLSGDGATVDGVNYGVWNMYNRVPITMRLTDSATSHTYSTTTIRAWGGSTQFQVRFMRGLNEDAVIADVRATMSSTNAGDQGVVGVGLDATDAFVGLLVPTRMQAAPTYPHAVSGRWSGLPGLGKHYLSWNEYPGGAVGTLTWYGDANVPTWWQSGMEVQTWA